MDDELGFFVEYKTYKGQGKCFTCGTTLVKGDKALMFHEKGDLKRWQRAICDSCVAEVHGFVERGVIKI